MNKGSKFKQRVLDIVRYIPKGRTMTYGQVAAMAGSSGAARVVGNIMSKNFDPKIPCHRVVGANNIGGYNRGVKQKKKLLRREGAL